jgi:short chain dehydrogenase
MVLSKRRKEPMMNISFEDKVALVTGAGSGLGLATARAFAASGASVAPAVAATILVTFHKHFLIDYD